MGRKPDKLLKKLRDQLKKNKAKIKEEIKSKSDLKIVSVKISVDQYLYMKANDLNISKLLRLAIDDLMK